MVEQIEAIYPKSQEISQKLKNSENEFGFEGKAAYLLSPFEFPKNLKFDNSPYPKLIQLILLEHDDLKPKFKLNNLEAMSINYSLFSPIPQDNQEFLIYQGNFFLNLGMTDELCSQKIPQICGGVIRNTTLGIYTASVLRTLKEDASILEKNQENLLTYIKKLRDCVVKDYATRNGPCTLERTDYH